MNQWAQWEVERRLETAARNLERNGFQVGVCANREQVVACVLERAEGARTVGFGGSVTLVELGLPERMTSLGKETLIHGAPGLTLEQRLEVMRRQLTCDLFLTGANAVTLDGKIVNIDATGNRISAMTFGPKRVTIVAGANKLAADADQGLRRVRAWASPPNAYRLGMKTPCATTGECSDCRSPERICRVVHVMERAPRLTDVQVLLVGESLGL